MLKFSRKNVVRSLFFVVAIALISYFIPRESDQDFNYTIGRPWTYPLLTAPFDIPVNLDSASAAKQRDSIDRAFVPVFKRDDGVVRKNLGNLSAALSKTGQVSAELNRSIVEAVEQMYSDGIVDSGTYSDISSGKMKNMRFIVGNVAQLVPTGKYRSVRKAYASIDSMFPMPYARIIIDNVKLSQYLHPNVVRDSIESERLLEQAYLKALAPIGVKQKGERIVDRGEIITPQIYEILKEYERLLQSRNTAVKSSDYRYAGQIAVVVMIILCFYTFLYYFRHRTFDDMRRWLLWDGGQGQESLNASWKVTGFGGNTCQYLGVEPLNGTRRHSIELYTKYATADKSNGNDPIDEFRPDALNLTSVSFETNEGEPTDSKVGALTNFYRQYLNRKDRYADGNSVDNVITFKPQYYFIGFKQNMMQNNTKIEQTIGWTDINKGGANGTFDPLAE